MNEFDFSNYMDLVDPDTGPLTLDEALDDPFFLGDEVHQYMTMVNPETGERDVLLVLSYFMDVLFVWSVKMQSFKTLTKI